MLRNKPSGSFVVRNSHSFAGGYGLALKVSHLPPNVQAKGGKRWRQWILLRIKVIVMIMVNFDIINIVDDYEANLVRHYLIESTPKGVKLKGCSNEPVFRETHYVYHHQSMNIITY